MLIIGSASYINDTLTSSPRPPFPPHPYRRQNTASAGHFLSSEDPENLVRALDNHTHILYQDPRSRDILESKQPIALFRNNGASPHSASSVYALPRHLQHMPIDDHNANAAVPPTHRSLCRLDRRVRVPSAELPRALPSNVSHEQLYKRSLIQTSFTTRKPDSRAHPPHFPPADKIIPLQYPLTPLPD